MSASVRVGSVPPRPKAAGPGTAPALAGPTVTVPEPSVEAMDEPPRPTETIPGTGNDTGTPRISGSVFTSWAPSRTSPRSRVVPPMSKATAAASP